MTLQKGSTVLQSSGTQGIIQVMYCTQLMIESKIKRNCNRTQKRLVEPRHVFRQHLFNLRYSNILGQPTQQVYSWQKFELFQLNLSVDETLTAFQGRLSMKEKKQYVPSKPIKTGTKVWESAGSSNGNVCTSQVAEAPRWRSNRARIWLSRSARAQPSRRIFRDNSFSSLKFVCDLLRDETYICETICLNRRGFQNGVSPQNAAVLNLTKRQIEILQPWRLCCISLERPKLVCFLSTLSNSVGNQTASRKQNNGTFVQVSTVPAAISYHQNMGGVDLDDQLCQGPQVSKVVTIFALVASRCQHRECTHFGNRSKKSPLQASAAVSDTVGEDGISCCSFRESAECLVNPVLYKPLRNASNLV